ncbi:hypothetical protein PAESOLCIP111_01829 [Paenibacillus solanacearum]|uniref:DUF3231 family protein n=1 Tax=Paenibacillus solanacearum TaxID=2048548 RepID=A0A916NPL7_9BACL|nr:DUF3231 family protein [Paenibacillus solanacearum]CAG7615812.1 hypothetical protein PAESOLCIP111_01829 [Paenibacillus solanacearum]
MENAHHIRLTATELGTLWATYINDTMARCVISYFLAKIEDTEAKPVIELALSITESHIEQLSKLFQSENFPIPHGFSDEDVRLSAKRLYSDSFFLYYIKNMATVGLATYGVAFTSASRSDARDFFHRCLLQTVELDQAVTAVLQSKGLYIRPPYITAPDSVHFVENTRFLSGGFFGFVEKRPLISIEIAHLFSNAQTNGLGCTLLLGFSQVVHNQKLRDYFARGTGISAKHTDVFAKILKDEHLPVPMTWDSDVTTSTEAPFSDKLMLFHVSLLVAAGTGNYGAAAAASPRKDVAAQYVRLAAEIASYAEDGATLMIEHGWLEEPPHAPKRSSLISASQS